MGGSSVERNINAIRTSLKGMQRDVKEKVYQELQEITLDLAIKASALAPIDTGELRKSVNPEVKVTGTKTRALVTFSAINPENGYDYAMIQHENLEFNHPRGGQAKYLEQPLNENSEKYKKQLSDIIGKALRL